MDKETVKIIEDLRLQVQQLEFQLRGKINSVEGGAEDWLNNNDLEPNANRPSPPFHYYRSEVINLLNEHHNSQMKKKVEEITGDEIFKYVNKHTDTNSKVREVEAIECVLHFLTQLIK